MVKTGVGVVRLFIVLRRLATGNGEGLSTERFSADARRLGRGWGGMMGEESFLKSLGDGFLAVWTGGLGTSEWLATMASKRSL